LNYRWLRFMIAQFNQPSQNAREHCMSQQPIHTADAPDAIGTYAQTVRCGDTLYPAGQIGLDTATMQMNEGINAQIHRVFKNLQAVAAAGVAGLSRIALVEVDAVMVLK